MYVEIWTFKSHQWRRSWCCHHCESSLSSLDEYRLSVFCQMAANSQTKPTMMVVYWCRCIITWHRQYTCLVLRTHYSTNKCKREREWDTSCTCQSSSNQLLVSEAACSPCQQTHQTLFIMWLHLHASITRLPVPSCHQSLAYLSNNPILSSFTCVPVQFCHHSLAYLSRPVCINFTNNVHSLQIWTVMTRTTEQATRMSADVQRDGHPAKYRWRPLWKFHNSIA